MCIRDRIDNQARIIEDANQELAEYVEIPAPEVPQGWLLLSAKSAIIDWKDEVSVHLSLPQQVVESYGLDASQVADIEASLLDVRNRVRRLELDHMEVQKGTDGAATISIDLDQELIDQANEKLVEILDQLEVEGRDGLKRIITNHFVYSDPPRTNIVIPSSKDAVQTVKVTEESSGRKKTSQYTLYASSVPTSRLNRYLHLLEILDQYE